MRAGTGQSRTIPWTAGHLPDGGGYEAARHLLHLRRRFQGGWEEQSPCRSCPRHHCRRSHRLGRTADWRASGDDWAGAWSGIGYAVFVHAYDRRHTRRQHRDFRVSSSRAECPRLPTRRKKGGLGLDVP